MVITGVHCQCHLRIIYGFKQATFGLISGGYSCSGQGVELVAAAAMVTSATSSSSSYTVERSGRGRRELGTVAERRSLSLRRSEGDQHGTVKDGCGGVGVPYSTSGSSSTSSSPPPPPRSSRSFPRHGRVVPQAVLPRCTGMEPG